MVSKPSKARVAGPLASYEESFGAALVRAGYQPSSAKGLVLVMAHLSRWLEAAQLGTADLSQKVVSAFLSTRREAGYAKYLSPKALRPLLDHLRGLGAMREESAAVAPIEELTGRYRRYLAAERDLAPRSVDLYVRSVRPFVARFYVAVGGLRLDEVRAADVAAFVVEQSRRSTASRLIRVPVRDGNSGSSGWPHYAAFTTPQPLPFNTIRTERGIIRTSA